MSKQRKPIDAAENPATGESRAADALTVFWMIAVIQTLACDLAVAGLLLYARFNPPAERTLTFAKVMYLSAALAGSVSLLLLIVVLRIRRVPPPRGIVVFGVVVAAAPIISMLFGIGL